MAISIAQQYYSDLTNITDPLRMLQGFDYFGHSDQMEFSISTGLDEVIIMSTYTTPTHIPMLYLVRLELIAYGFLQIQRNAF